MFYTTFLPSIASSKLMKEIQKQYSLKKKTSNIIQCGVRLHCISLSSRTNNGLMNYIQSAILNSYSISGNIICKKNRNLYQGAQRRPRLEQSE